MRLVADLFPGLDLPTKLSESLQKSCVEFCRVILRPRGNVVTKVMHFQELLDVRHSVVLLGPAGCGKTSVWKTLSDATQLHETQARLCLRDSDSES